MRARLFTFQPDYDKAAASYLRRLFDVSALKAVGELAASTLLAVVLVPNDMGES